MMARTRTLWRLYAVQAAWTYERMAGIGVGHAAAPMLRDVFAAHPARERREAVARSADFFNSHPYLAGVAVGAVVKSEQDGVPGEVISRLRIALSGPLGALGDQLIWAGWVPTLIGVGLIASIWIGLPAIIAIVVVHNVLRFLLMRWGLDLGLREGLHVGAALQQSWLPRSAADAQRAAAFAIGLALPIVAWHVLLAAVRWEMAATIVVALVGVVLGVLPVTRSRTSGLRFGLVVVGATLLIVGGLQ